MRKMGGEGGGGGSSERRGFKVVIEPKEREREKPTASFPILEKNRADSVALLQRSRRSGCETTIVERR